MKYSLLSLLLAMGMLISCDITIKKQGEAKTNSKIRNGIDLKAEGVTVEQAFLINEDGSLVSEDNIIKVNQRIRIRMIVSGWIEQKGKVFLEASEKAVTSDGDVLLDEKDLFKNYADGIDAADAGYITLSFQLTQVDKIYDYFKISFRVADKKDATKFVEGSYKLYM